MAKQVSSVFLEDWLKDISGYSSTNTFSSKNPFASSARPIIQAWAELRDSIQNQSFHSNHVQALKTLVNSQASLHVAEPQAKLVLSILSSPNFSLPHESYPLLLRLLYVWVRKSTRPSSALIDSAVEAISHCLSSEFDYSKNPLLFSEGVLLLGSLAFVRSASESSKRVCLEFICRLLEEKYPLMGSFEGIVPDVLAGIGYALCSSVNVYYVGTLDFLLGIWGKVGGPQGSLSHGLMILHLIEWVMSYLINSRSLENLTVFSREALETTKEKYVPFAVVMAAAGVLRALNKSASSGLRLDILSRLRVSAEDRIEYVARNLISKTSDFPISQIDLTVSLSLQCLSLALARSGPVSSRSPFFVCLASSLLTEIFPLGRFYAKVLETLRGNPAAMLSNEVKEHLESVPFKEAGTITRVLCNQYVSVDGESQKMVENHIWDYCHYIYTEHRKVALTLRGEKDELLMNMEKIAESAFLMVVVFALTVTKHKFNSKSNQETKVDISVRILAAFSCLEYFRRIRLPEYMDTIRVVVVSIQENDSACVSFVECIPTYIDLTNGPDLNFQCKTEYVWCKDEVQTARILFYLRVIATCIEHLPSPVFGKVVAPTMFLYLGHPNGKVARASHSMFVAFVSLGKESNEEERVSLKEKLVFYYMQRSLLEYPGITPFEGMASGVAALVRHLPAGSPAIFYCVHCLVEKADRLCREDFSQQADMWKSWQGESEPCKKILDLLLRLISMVDIQVLPELMKLLAQLIVQLPKDGQVMVLNELYSLVAESDDVTRKPTLVSWLQSLSYLCFQAKSEGSTSKGKESKEKITYMPSKDHQSHNSLNARL
ncbi:Armadillo-type fold containing protein [Trema orientale]|uniref:Armadillo-type fold containing protein n=1 Tax=Trema orientale TaxID=63057 RepID=A0A2P5G0J5_TREOI|nr:Armadillo-type fold containing protein [Trema orientale]